ASAKNGPLVYIAGFSGSCHDSYFFNQNQFLHTDSALTSDWFTLPAYNGKDLLDHQNVDFNYHLSQSQVRIEHAIGILKGKFSSLCELRTQIRNHKEMKDTL
ncbi:hypothetical protein VP01_8185g2, partial [Puccinia sorghi]